MCSQCQFVKRCNFVPDRLWHDKLPQTPTLGWKITFNMASEYQGQFYLLHTADDPKTKSFSNSKAF